MSIASLRAQLEKLKTCIPTQGARTVEVYYQDSPPVPADGEQIFAVTTYHKGDVIEIEGHRADAPEHETKHDSWPGKVTREDQND